MITLPRGSCCEQTAVLECFSSTCHQFLILDFCIFCSCHKLFERFNLKKRDTLYNKLPQVGQALTKSVCVMNLSICTRYGWSNFRNVSSLISGVGIFCVGAGLSWYHGIVGLMNPTEVTSLFWVSIVMWF